MANEIEKSLVVNKLTGDVELGKFGLRSQTKRYEGNVLINGKECGLIVRRDFYDSDGNFEIEVKDLEYEGKDYDEIENLIIDMLYDIDDWGDYE